MNKFLFSLDAQFALLHARSVALLRAVPEGRLYWEPRGPQAAVPARSCGEHLLRGAATVEQTFGGITASLWDDPFEWTLPETLSTTPLVEEYLNEAEATRRRGFAFIGAGDDALSKEIAVPAGGTRTLFGLILETLALSSHHQGRAFATFRLFSDARLPQL